MDDFDLTAPTLEDLMARQAQLEEEARQVELARRQPSRSAISARQFFNAQPDLFCGQASLF